MNRPPLVIVTTSFPIRSDGSEAAGAFVAELAERMAATRQVRVVAPGLRNEVEPWKGGISVHRYAAARQPLSLLSPLRPTHWPPIAGILRDGATATLQASGAGRGHLLACWALPSGYWAARAAARHGGRYAVWTLGSDIWALGRIPLVRGLLGRVLRGADVCFSDGLALARDTQKLGRRSVEFLPSARLVDAPSPRPLRARPPYRLLFLGRWHPNKGVDLLLDALEALPSDAWKRLGGVTIAGGGPLEEVVRRRASQLARSPRPLRVLGFLDAADAYAEIGRHDYLVIPSRIESIPLIYSDALRCGRPVIATPVGDLGQLIGEGGTGICADSASAEGLREAIVRALARSPTEFSAALALGARRFSLTESVVPRLERWLDG